LFILTRPINIKSQISRWLNFDPQSGHEQMGKRPALVVSNTEFNQQRGFILVCPISNIKRKNLFYVNIPDGEAVTGVLMADQLRSLDYRSRDAELIAICPKELLMEVLGRIYPIMF
jgi:mRNA interferase MazF